MKRAMNLMWAVLAASAAGCTGFEPVPPSQPTTIGQAHAAIAGRTPQQAMQHLEATAQKGETIGDLATPEAQSNFAVMADSIVVGLDGRGTNRYDPKLKPALVKLLVKNYDSLDIASQIINSRDAAPVRVIAEMPPFVRKDDKFDVIVECTDPSVNIEGGTLVDTPLVRYVQMDVPTHAGFRTPSGLVSQGTEAYARGDVTLSAGYREGVRLKSELPTVGYVPAGAMAEKTWGYRLMLKKPDANTSLLIDARVRERFGAIATSPNVAFIAVSMPNRYQPYWKRYLDVVTHIPVRRPSKEERLAHMERLASALASNDPVARYDAECALEAYGRECAPALLETLRTANPAQRQSALRVLAFVEDHRAVEPLIEESRRSQGRFRAESAYLLSILGGDPANARLVEMLGESDPLARFEALMCLERTGVRDAPVKTYYSPVQRNFAMYLVDVPGDRAVVVKSLEGVRRIALFGGGIRMKSGFRGSVGPVTVSVTSDTTEILHKRRESGQPIVLKTVELQNLVSALDRMNVSVNDIIGVMSQMNEKGALEAKLWWAD